MTQLTFAYPPEYFQPKPKPLTLSYWARRVYWLMKAVSCGRDFCFPSHAYIAKRLGKSIRSIIRWIQELVQFGHIEPRRRGPRSNEYRFLKPLEKSTGRGKDVEESKPAGKSRVTSFAGPSLYESQKQERTPAERSPDAASLSRTVENLGTLTLGGKPADPPLIRKLAKLLPTQEHWQRLRGYVRDFSRRDTVRGWGIIVRLAEQASLQKTS